MEFSWKAVGELVGAVAPIAGAALGGPAGGAIGSMIAGALGVDDNADAVAKALKADPSLAVKVKELEVEARRLELEAIAKERDAELEAVRIQLADVQNARGLQVEALRQDDTFSKRYVYYLASFWSIFAVIYVTAITFMQIPAANVRFADTILGFVLGTIIATVMNYFLGSSKSSADKTLHMADAAKEATK